MEKFLTIKGIGLFLLTMLAFSLNIHIKSTFVSFIGLDKIEGLFSLGPISFKKFFIYNLAFTILLSILNIGVRSTGILEEIVQFD
mgnify:CR=1 FL=1